MPAPSTLWLFAGASLVLLVVPGPAVLYVVARSIAQGRAAGVVSVLGVATGSVVHIVGAALGISALLVASATAFTTLKFIGAAYLICIGIRRLRGRDTGEPQPAPIRRSLGRVYRQGVVVQILNPKAALFLLAFLPQFVDSRHGPVVSQVLVLGALFVALSICSDGMYALVSSVIGVRLRRHERVTRAIDRASGIVYVGLGIAAALTRPNWSHRTMLPTRPLVK